MRRSLVWLVLTTLVVAAPRALAGAQARLSPDSLARPVTATGTARVGDTSDGEHSLEAPDAHSGLGAPSVAGLNAAAYDDPENATSAVNRHQLTAFLADL